VSEPLTLHEVDKLAIYNSERARGIVHTDAWREQMAELQTRFDRVGAEEQVGNALSFWAKITGQAEHAD